MGGTQVATQQENPPAEDADRASSDLSPEEKKEAEARALPRAAIVFEAIRGEGEGELDRALPALAFSGVAAGLSMGFSLFAMATLHTFLPDTHWRPLVEAFGYTLGFLIAVLGRQQLFTENTLTPILVLLNDFSLGMLWKVARLWAIVIVANLIGALGFAAMLSHLPVFSPEFERSLAELSLAASSDTAQQVLVRGIYAGWLIALMVWLLPAAEAAAIWIILFLTFIVSAAQLTHVVAGSVEVLYAVQIGEVSWSDFFLKFFLPVFVGNSIGGVTFVALLNFGQVAGDAKSKERKSGAK
jgi:formate/nitrite transporter FocA (FNT family)